MDRTEILQELQKNVIPSAKLPSQINFEIVDDSLKMKVKSAGVKDNMQNDGSAFEGWAIVLKSAFPQIKKVFLDWEEPVYNIGKENAQKAHYNRFVMRAANFRKAYKWFNVDKSRKQEVDAMQKRLNTRTPLVINFPKKECDSVTDESKKPEAALERKLVETWQKTCPITNEQLPVGLFTNGEVAIKNTFTPRGASQIDIWQISGDTITVHELKVKGNDAVGIISELMFYVCTVKNIVDGFIKYPDITKAKPFRQFKEFANAVQNGQINKVIGSFSTQSLHPLLAELQPTIQELLNDNEFGITFEFNEISI